MKLLIKQRLFTLTDNYYVYDETEEVRYEVQQAFFALGHQFHVYDRRADERSEEVGYIRQKLFSLMPTFEILINGQVVGTVRKEFRADSVSASSESLKEAEIRMVPPRLKVTAISREMVMISFSR